MTRGHARLLFCVGFSLLVGCGARTEEFLDDGSNFGAGGADNGGNNTSGATHVGGALQVGGAAQGGAGNTGAVSGFQNGGASGAFAGAGFGGVGVAGAPFSFGGVSGGATAGAPSHGGFGAVGGFIGEAGAGGLVEACVAASPTSCGQCVCQSCAPTIENCANDGGCGVILACVLSTGCQGFSCYANNTCRPVIDQNGGLFGTSMSIVFGLVTCTATAQNNCGCN